MTAPTLSDRPVTRTASVQPLEDAPEEAAPCFRSVEDVGLTDDEAKERLVRFGPNRLVPDVRRSGLRAWLLRPLADPMVVLLLVAGAAYVAMGENGNAVAIAVALVPISLVTLLLEGRAERTLDRLRQLTAPTATVRRSGRRQVVPVEELVPGDLVLVQEGDVFPADGVLIAGSELSVDESALTGESLPVLKTARETGTAADPHLFAGTTLLAGRGELEIASTGSRTRYGQIGQLVAATQSPPTPLQRLMRRLVRQFALLAAAGCVVIAGIELLRGNGWAAAVLAAVSLAIAAIPEEFPMVFTLYLALGSWRLAKEHALVRRLPAVETLGATTVICADKTGTLTLGRLDVVATVPDSAGNDAELIEAAVLACEPDAYDPLDQAILRCADAQGISTSALHDGALLHDYAFDQALRYLSHIWEHNGALTINAKGAVEAILDRCHTSERTRTEALAANAELAARGLRILAVAAGSLAVATGDRSRDESRLRYLGLIAFADPVRDGVVEAIRDCRRAGIRVVMATGDHPLTAQAIAQDLGILAGDERVVTGAELQAASEHELARLAASAAVFARVSPAQKHQLVRAFRAAGEVVAMTGDGINDAPALREADIGVAMGQRGTDVARAAATMVLLDDRFSTIVRAVREGRRIFENLRRAFAYLAAFNVLLLLTALVVPLLGQPLLLLPIHMIWLELIVHPTASLVFEADPATADIMDRAPRRPNADLFSRGDLLRLLGEGVLLFVAVLALFLSYLGGGATDEHARGVAIAALVVGQTLLVLIERAPQRPIWQVRATGNRWLPIVTAATLGSLLASLYLPSLASFQQVAPLSIADWLAVIAAVFLAVALCEAGRILLRPMASRLSSNLIRL